MRRWPREGINALGDDRDSCASTQIWQVLECLLCVCTLGSGCHLPSRASSSYHADRPQARCHQTHPHQAHPHQTHPHQTYPPTSPTATAKL